MRPALAVDVPRGTIVALRAAGFDVMAVAESHPASSDREVLSLARKSVRWLVTFDRDYGELIFKRGEAPPPCILYLRQRPHSSDSFAAWIIAALDHPSHCERLLGHLAVLDGRSVRLRPLPCANSDGP